MVQFPKYSELDFDLLAQQKVENNQGAKEGCSVQFGG